MIEYIENKVLKHSNSRKLEYIGKCLLISEKGKKILVIGDLHLGYEEVLNQSGVFVSRTMFEEMIKYLDSVFAKTGKVEHVVLLGDVKHDFGGILRQEWNDVLRLFDYLEDKCKEIIICKGNHDTILEPIVRKRENVKMMNYLIFGEYCFLHGNKDFPGIWNKKIRYWIMGHGHPAVKISDKTKVEKYKCFLAGRFKGRGIIIVPSFFEYTEGSDPRESNLGMAWDFDYGKFRVWVVGVEGDLEVLDFGKLRDLK